MQNGTDPTSESVQALAQRWLSISTGTGRHRSKTGVQVMGGNRPSTVNPAAIRKVATRAIAPLAVATVPRR
jgi:hypothetical protein